MNLTLLRSDSSVDGIFGELLDDSGNHKFYTLEHAYDSGAGNGSYASKVPAGEYKCVKGMHQLKSMSYPFQTFEVTNVPGHVGILFHVGNYNNDSSGCILVGTNQLLHTLTPMITKSQMAFDDFMKLQSNINEFTLTVKG